MSRHVGIAAREYTAHELIAALSRAGMSAAVVGTGGNCEAVEVHLYGPCDGTLPHVLITDGNLGVDFTHCETWDSPMNAGLAITPEQDDDVEIPFTETLPTIDEVVSATWSALYSPAAIVSRTRRNRGDFR